MTARVSLIPPETRGHRPAYSRLCWKNTNSTMRLIRLRASYCRNTQFKFVRRLRVSVMSYIAEFITTAAPPAEARRRAAIALCDTVGVILAGVPESAAELIRRTVVEESRGT